MAKEQIENGHHLHKEFVDKLQCLQEFFKVNNIDTFLAINLMQNLTVSVFVTLLDREQLEDYMKTGLEIYDLNMGKLEKGK